MAQLAHAEALDDARIEERRDSHHSRHGREGDGEERAEPEDVDEDLLARGHEAEHGAEQEHAGKAVEQRQPVREDDAEAAGNRLERELAAVFGVERLGQAEEGPEADQRRKAGHEHEDRLPRAGEQQYLADAGGDDGHGHEDHEDQRHDLGHVAAREAVADDGGRDHAGAAAPRPCVKRRARRTAKFGAKVAAKAQTT